MSDTTQWISQDGPYRYWFFKMFGYEVYIERATRKLPRMWSRTESGSRFAQLGKWFIIISHKDAWKNLSTE